MKKLVSIATISIMLALMATSIVSVSPVYAAPDVETLRPNAVGTDSEWTPVGATNNWECVDEVTPDETTYVSQAGNNKEDSYNLQPHTLGSGDISLVRVYARAKSTVAGDPLKIGVVAGATTDMSAGMAVTLAYFDYSYDWTQSPNTAAAWTWAEIDALEAAIGSGVVSGTVSVTTVWVEVTYTPDWNSYEDDYLTPLEDYNSGTFGTIYMKGTGFAIGNYKVRYWDAGAVQVGSDVDGTVSGDGILQSSLLCSTDPGAAPGIWTAKVHLLDDTLIAEDTFTVQSDVIPEFPTIFAAIAVAGLCFGIYYWMRKKTLKFKMQSAKEI